MRRIRLIGRDSAQTTSRELKTFPNYCRLGRGHRTRRPIYTAGMEGSLFWVLMNLAYISVNYFKNPENQASDGYTGNY